MSSVWTFVIMGLACANCALIGSYLVLRRMAMVADAIAHATLPGIVIALLITGSKYSWILSIGAVFTGFLVTFLISFLEKKVKVQTDAAIGINFTFLFALGIILISFFSKKIDLDPECSLYGDLAMAHFDHLTFMGDIDLGPKAFYLLLLSFCANFLFIGFFYYDLYISTFDLSFAQSIGLPVYRLQYWLMGMTSFTAVASFGVVGAILVVALFVVPSVTASFFVSSVTGLLMVSFFIGLITSFLGYQLALVCNSSLASAIAVIALFFFLVSFFYHKKKYF